MKVFEKHDVGESFWEKGAYTDESRWEKGAYTGDSLWEKGAYTGESLRNREYVQIKVPGKSGSACGWKSLRNRKQCEKFLSIFFFGVNFFLNREHTQVNVFDNHASHEEFCLFNFCLHGSVQLQFFQVFMKHRVIDKVMVNETCTSDLNFVLPWCDFQGWLHGHWISNKYTLLSVALVPGHSLCLRKSKLSLTFFQRDIWQVHCQRKCFLKLHTFQIVFPWPCIFSVHASVTL